MGLYDEGSVCGREGKGGVHPSLHTPRGVFEEMNAVGKEGRRREGWGV
jgi:hypothetical protein